MAETQKDLRFSRLLDYYGELLTEKQRDFMDLYYNEDFSLAEISEHENITRQGVRDGIKHAEQRLLEFEEKLGLAEKAEIYYALNSKVASLAEDIRIKSGNTRSAAAENASEIEKIMKKYRDLF
ncbi:MAG: YlxM family DNA-binding protein [Oscillospiraceae bacterium]